MPIDTLVFDLGGVLIDWNPRYVYRTIFDTEEEVDYFLDNICTSEWNVQQDAGRPLAEATESLVAAHPDWEPQIRAYYDRWPEMLGGEIAESVAVLKNLQQGGQHRLYALTNWSHETFPIALARFDFLKIFEGILVSGEEKLIKPDFAIYQRLYDKFQIDPQSAVFIDDSLKNVRGAKEAGMQAIHFHSSLQMKKDLFDLI